MACIAEGFTDRKDEKYIKFLEDKYKERELQASGAAADPVLTQILNRLDRLESGGNRNPQQNPSPAELAQLSDSIHQVSLSVHPEPSKSGIEMRPEYYVHVVVKGRSSRNMQMCTMRAKELMFGMINVYDYLLSGGEDAGGYFKHLLFVFRHLMERNFTVGACARYDKYVVDQVLAGKGKFNQPDPVAIGLFLHGGAVNRGEQQQTQYTQAQTQRQPLASRYPQLRECNRENTPVAMPGNWPQEICFNFNTESCFGRCSKHHVCGYCRLKHRLADCKFAVNQVQEQSRF